MESPESLANWADVRFGFVARRVRRPETEFEAECRRKEVAHEPLWVELLMDWEQHHWKVKTLRRLALKGIPEALRGAAWRCLAATAELRAMNGGRQCYAALLEQELSDGHATAARIAVDVSRAFCEHALLRDADGPGQRSLVNVLRAYAAYNPSVGYCGGLASVAGVLVMHLPEEDAFWALVRLTLDGGLERLYMRSSSLGLRQCLGALNRLLAVFLPDLARHLAAEEIDTNMFAARWFLTLFVNSLPFTAVLRFFDAFVLDGFDALFIMAVALLSQLAAHIKTLKMDQILRFLHSELEQSGQLDVERLMKRYARLSARVKHKVHNYFKVQQAQFERTGRAYVSANKEGGGP